MMEKFNASLNSSTVHGDTSISELFPSLVQCFTVIFCGYIAGRCDMINPTQSKGLGTYITQFSLPAVFFRVMVGLDFSHVSWRFVFAVSLAKTIMFIIVITVVLLLFRPLNYGMAGILSTFATQSNDVALGYPILMALYPSYASYIYLFAPAQLIFLNPISFILMEWQSLKNSQSQEEQNEGSDNQHKRKMSRKLLQVLRKVFLHPLVYMTIIGVIFNIILNHKIPYIVDKVLEVLGVSFSGTALFYLGLGMVGKMGKLDKRGIYIVVFILLAKQILMAFITREVVNLFQPGVNVNETMIFNIIGFLYGALPTAPPVYLFAAEFQIIPDVIATALVIGTFISGPIMYISARLVSIRVYSPTMFDALLSAVSMNIALLSIISSLWVIGLFLFTRRITRLPHQVTAILLMYFLWSCVGMILDVVVHQDRGYTETDRLANRTTATADLRHYVQFIVFFMGVTGARIWTVILSLILLICNSPRHYNWLKFRCHIYAIGFGAPILITGVLLLIATNSQQSISEIDPAFQYGRPQTIVSLIVLTFSFLCSSGLLIALARASNKQEQLLEELTKWTSSNASSGEEEEFDTNGKGYSILYDRTVCLRDYEKDIRYTDINNDKFSLVDSDKEECESMSSPHRIQVPDEGQFRLHSLGARSITDAMRNIQDIQLHRHVILVILLLLTMTLGIFLCMWRLVEEAVTGVYIELEFLDSVFNFGQGFIAFCVFGLDTELVIQPCRRMLRRIWYGPEILNQPAVATLPSDVLAAKEKFVKEHMTACQDDIVTDKRRFFVHYYHVFTASDLIDWMLSHQVVKTRNEGVIFGQKLQLSGVIQHVSQECVFHEKSDLLFRFCDISHPAE